MQEIADAFGCNVEGRKVGKGDKLIKEKDKTAPPRQKVSLFVNGHAYKEKGWESFVRSVKKDELEEALEKGETRFSWLISPL